MRKIVILFILVVAIIFSFYIYSSAKLKVLLPKPEDKAGKSSSVFEEVKAPGVQAAKGASEFKVTGPVKVYDLDDDK